MATGSKLSIIALVLVGVAVLKFLTTGDGQSGGLAVGSPTGYGNNKLGVTIANNSDKTGDVAIWVVSQETKSEGCTHVFRMPANSTFTQLRFTCPLIGPEERFRIGAHWATRNEISVSPRIPVNQ